MKKMLPIGQSGADGVMWWACPTCLTPKAVKAIKEALSSDFTWTCQACPARWSHPGFVTACSAKKREDEQEIMARDFDFIAYAMGTKRARFIRDAVDAALKRAAEPESMEQRLLNALIGVTDDLVLYHNNADCLPAAHALIEELKETVPRGTEAPGA